MLKRKNLIALAVVVVVLAAISVLQRTSHRRATSGSPTAPVLGAQLDQESLRRIEIGYGTVKDAVVLENLPDGWVVRSAWNHPVNQSRIDNLLQDLSSLEGEFRSDSPEVLADYGFTDSTAVTVVAFGSDPQPVFALEVGDKPQRSVGNFVKRPGSSEVFLARKSILSDLGLYNGPGLPESKHFLDLEARKVDRLDVESITLHDGDAVVAMEKVFAPPEPAADDTTGAAPEIDRNTYEWRLVRPVEKAAMKTRCDGVLGAVSTVRAVDIDDPAGDLAAYGLAAPAKRVEVTLQDGTGYALRFGAERPESEGKQKGVYMQVEGEPTVWVVTEYLLKNIFKTQEELLPEDS
jgi:hypothetical protein